MQEKLGSAGKKLKEFFSKMSKRTRVILAIVAAVVAVTVVAVVLIQSNKAYTVLFTGLSSEETSSILTYLNDNGTTDYKVEGNDTILVPEDKEAQLKANLLMQGYPTSGFAYQTYRAGVSTMSTESDRKIAYIQDLQDRMAGVIRCLDGVKDAVVTIASGEDRQYVLDSSNVIEATASVMVTMSGGVSLTDQQAGAIRNLVSHGVQGLKIGNVAISDSRGNVYSSGSGTASATGDSQLKLQLEEQVNKKVRDQIMTVLLPLYGADNVHVAVSSMVDVNHTVQETTEYTEPAWAADGSTKGEGIIGSKVYDQEIVRGDGTTAGGTVGNQSNADINTYMQNSTNLNGNETYVKNQGNNTYDVNTDKRQIERVAGMVSDLMVSVSINSAAAGTVDTQTLIGHIARAAGISEQDQENKISILTEPFYQAPTNTDQTNITPQSLLQRIPVWALWGGAGVLVILIALLLILHKRRQARKRAELREVLDSFEPEMPAALREVETGADIMNIKTERSIQLRQEIRKFVEENPEMTAQLLKSWLKGGEEDA